MQTFNSKVARRVYYALACAALLVGCIIIFEERMGTHRLPIHLLAVVLAVGFLLVAPPRKGEGALQLLGLSWPRYTNWVWVMILIGVAGGIARYASYRVTGTGGVKLYEDEFVPLLRASSTVGILARYAVFLVGAYLAVLVPGVLFWSVIQEPLSQAGAFALGLVLQSATFGLTHCYMTGLFDLTYGAEAFLGSLVSGVVYEKLKNVYVPALLMSSSVATSTFLLRAVS
jgi:membrane protease YdiL (CAAX protease family)